MSLRTGSSPPGPPSAAVSAAPPAGNWAAPPSQRGEPSVRRDGQMAAPSAYTPTIAPAIPCDESHSAERRIPPSTVCQSAKARPERASTRSAAPNREKSGVGSQACTRRTAASAPACDPRVVSPCMDGSRAGPAETRTLPNSAASRSEGFVISRSGFRVLGQNTKR